jgi:hypothetical protein
LVDVGCIYRPVMKNGWKIIMFGALPTIKHYETIFLKLQFGDFPAMF